MRVVTYIIILLLNLNPLLSQKLIFSTSNLDTSAILFTSIEGEKAFVVDSIYPNEKKQIIIETNKYFLHHGFYQIIFHDNKRIIFIYDRKDIDIQADNQSIDESPKVIKSQTNQLYFQFLRLTKSYKDKSELLHHILDNYPKADDYYDITLRTLARIQSTYLEFVNKTSQMNKKSFIARYIRSARLPVIDGQLSAEERGKMLRKHSLDNVDFADPELIFSDVFTNKSIEYLSYYRNPHFPKDLLEKEFMKAVEILLEKAKRDHLIYQHITEYFIEGFRKFGFDHVIDYIIENYIIKDDLCLNESLSGSLERRIEHARLFKPGNTVPNIVMSDASGSPVELNRLNTDIILILFYASWCTHCQSLLPRINNLYKNQEVLKTEVFAISLDTVKSEWLDFVRDNDLSWINVSDLKGWDGISASDYFIYATPTMILIDNQYKIISKPLSVEELKDWF